MLGRPRLWRVPGVAPTFEWALLSPPLSHSLSLSLSPPFIVVLKKPYAQQSTLILRPAPVELGARLCAVIDRFVSAGVAGPIVTSRVCAVMMWRAHAVSITVFLMVETAVAQVGGVAGPGCADGSREGFTDSVAYPKIAACAGSARGVDVTSAAATTQFCSSG